MEFTEKHKEFEENCRQAIGLTLSEVIYAEVPYDKFDNNYHIKPYYTTSFDNIDSIDFAITFLTDSSRFRVYWDSKFFAYGINVKFLEEKENLLSDKEQLWNVSSKSFWAKNIGATIEDINVYWEEIKEKKVLTGTPSTYIYPQALKLSLSNGQVAIISAAGFINQNEEEAMGMLDNLLVTNNEELAIRVKLI